MSTDQADPNTPEREAHVRPEDVKKIGGAQSIDDKVETWQRQIEAGENQSDDSTTSDLLWYGALFGALVLGSLMSGFSLSGGGDGGGVFLGLVALAPWGVFV